jgi:hypothetical protein
MVPKGNCLSAEQFDVLQFRMPRGSGASTLCYHISQQFKCPIVVRDINKAEYFKHCRKLWGGSYTAPVVSPIELRSFCSFGCEAPESQANFQLAVKESNLIVFDVFRAYDNNRIVKQLISDLAGNCQFVMFQ